MLFSKWFSNLHNFDSCYAKNSWDLWCHMVLLGHNELMTVAWHALFTSHSPVIMVVADDLVPIWCHGIWGYTPKLQQISNSINFVNWTSLGTKLIAFWIKVHTFSSTNTFRNIIYQMLAILFRPQYVKIDFSPYIFLGLWHPSQVIMIYGGRVSVFHETKFSEIWRKYSDIFIHKNAFENLI